MVHIGYVLRATCYVRRGNRWLAEGVVSIGFYVIVRWMRKKAYLGGARRSTFESVSYMVARVRRSGG